MGPRLGPPTSSISSPPPLHPHSEMSFRGVIPPNPNFLETGGNGVSVSAERPGYVQMPE